MISSDMPPANAPVVEISGDTGGQVFPRQVQVEQWRKDGRKIKIAGTCASACTLVLGLPTDQVCVTPKAVLGFHEGSNGTATASVWRAYPAKVKGWLAQENAQDSDRNVQDIPLTPEVRWLKGAALQGKLRACDRRDALNSITG